MDPLACEPLLAEFHEKLLVKFKRTQIETDTIVGGWRAIAKVCDVTGNVSGSSDPDDNFVLECAVNGSATHIVTGDKKHLLPLGSFRGIPIVPPAEFLRIVEGEREAADQADDEISSH